jgi:hypothetical protein
MKPETETAEEQLARRFFEAERLDVIRMPTGATPTGDYLVSGDGPGYAVEVKSRGDDETLAARLADGEVVDGEGLVDRDDAIERIARKGRKQLAGIDPEHRRIWVLWFSLDAAFGSDVLLHRCAGTVYGIRQCLYPDEGGNAISIDCIYARPGVFERWSEIDAVVIANITGFAMLANELSPRFPILRSLRIPQKLGRAFYVPSDREKQRDILIADTAVNRRDEQALIESLRAKYHIDIRFIADPTHAWAAMKSEQ